MHINNNTTKYNISKYPWIFNIYPWILISISNIYSQIFIIFGYFCGYLIVVVPWPSHAVKGVGNVLMWIWSQSNEWYISMSSWWWSEQGMWHRLKWLKQCQVVRLVKTFRKEGLQSQLKRITWSICLSLGYNENCYFSNPKIYVNEHMAIISWSCGSAYWHVGICPNPNPNPYLRIFPTWCTLVNEVNLSCCGLCRCASVI